MTDETNPSHDAVAEQSVLGAMLISRDAIAEVSDILDGGDFYRPMERKLPQRHTMTTQTKPAANSPWSKDFYK